MVDKDHVYDCLIVECLEKYPVLWDSTHKNYKKIIERKLAVKAIASTVQGDSEADVLFVNERIKVIKAKLHRRLKPPPFGSGAKKHQHWPLEEKLGFLKGIPGPTKTNSSLEKPTGLVLLKPKAERLANPHSSLSEVQEDIEVEVDMDYDDELSSGASNSSPVPHRPPSPPLSLGDSAASYARGKKRRADLLDSALEMMLRKAPRFHEMPVPRAGGMNEALCQELLAVLHQLPELLALQLRIDVHHLMSATYKEFLEKENKKK